jgi:transcriptional regulator with XRE-family HTH domain
VKRKDPKKAQEIGERIAEARLSAGMNQRELGELLEVSERSIQAYEQGETIPWRFMGRLSEVLDKPVSWLQFGESAVALSGNSENLIQIGVGELRSLRGMLEQELLSLHDEIKTVTDTLGVLREEVERLSRIRPTTSLRTDDQVF